MNGVPNLSPALDRAIDGELFDSLHRSIKCDPRHYFGMREVLSGTAHLPNALVRLAPDDFKMIEKGTRNRRPSLGRRQAVRASLKHRVGDLSVNIELELGSCSIADANRPSVFETR